MAHAGATKYRILYTGGGNPNSRRDTLVDGGPLKINTDHYFNTALPDHINTMAGGDLELSQHLMEYIILDVLEWSNELVARNLVWTLAATRTSRFLAVADATGLLKWQKFASPEALIVHLREVNATLPPADRIVSVQDVVAFAPPGNGQAVSVFEYITAASFRSESGRMTAAVDFKSLLSGGYTAAGRADAHGHFQASLDVRNSPLTSGS